MDNEQELYNVSVLIVEDDPASRIHLSKILSKYVKTIYEAEDGLEGLNFYKKNHIDIVFTDIDMPNMNGIEMSKQIKSYDKNARIIIISAVDNYDKIIETIDIGVSKYILKPLDKDKVKDAVINVANSVLMEKEIAAKNLQIFKFMTGLEQSGNSINIIDKNGNIEYSNNIFIELFGKYDNINKFLKDISIEDSEITKNGELLIERIFSHNVAFALEFNRYISAQDRWFYMKFTPFYPDEENQNILITITDTTKEILTRKEIELINADLEDRVVQRTEQLHKSNRKLMKEIETRVEIENQLVQAKDKAEAANTAKNSFLAKISHELRTPLNGIIGLTSIMLDEIEDERYNRFLKMIEEEGYTLLNIINEILDLTKIESGSLYLSFHKFSLRNLIDECYGLFNYIAATKNIKFYTEIDDSVPEEFYSDSKRIRQILVTLLSNAFRFTESGEVAIFVRVLDNNSKFYNVEFEVKDTGMGIPEDRFDNLFKNFSQLDESYTRKFGGVGLGLRIAKGIVDLLAGDISLKSEVGKGSNFYFKLPLKIVK